LGNPTISTSASTFSSRHGPAVKKEERGGGRGEKKRVGVAKRAFPWPPRPPGKKKRGKGRGRKRKEPWLSCPSVLPRKTSLTKKSKEKRKRGKGKGKKRKGKEPRFIISERKNVQVFYFHE